MINLLCEKKGDYKWEGKVNHCRFYHRSTNLVWLSLRSGVCIGKTSVAVCGAIWNYRHSAPLIIWVLNASFMYISAEYARLKNATNYRDMVSIYYDHPTVNKIALFLWDILIFMAAITVSASCTAGTGSLLQDVFGFPYFVGCAVFIVGMALLLSLGKGILERLGKFGVPLIIIFLHHLSDSHRR